MPRLRPAPKKLTSAHSNDGELWQTPPPDPEAGEELRFGKKEKKLEAAPEASVEEALVPEVSESEGTESASAFKAQIAALEQANRDYVEQIERERQARVEALQKAADREVEVHKLQEQTVNSQQEAINAALAAAQNEAEAAQRDFEAAVQMADAKGQAEANRRLSRAEAKVLTLENGKLAIEQEIKERPKFEPPRVEQDELDRTNLPPIAKAWLRNHRDYLSDPRKNAKIQALHWDLVDDGYPEYSTEYFVAMEERLKMKRPEPRYEEQEVEDEPSPRRIASAPPSRDVPDGRGQRNNGRITLTHEQKEAARVSGITEAEYAVQLLNLEKEKNKGNYR